MNSYYRGLPKVVVETKATLMHVLVPEETEWTLLDQDVRILCEHGMPDLKLAHYQALLYRYGY